MNNTVEGRPLSKNAQTALGVLVILTALTLIYFHFLEQGPVQWVAGWIADRNGRYSVNLAFLLALFPFFLVELLLVVMIDRLVSRRD